LIFSDAGEASEDEEPVHALDLRICKAAESITIFDEENVLAASSAAGPERIRKKHLSGRFSPYPAPVHPARMNIQVPMFLNWARSLP
jgi:hypothetical protein